MIRILYFARLREVLGTDSESLPIPDSVHTLGDLREWLSRRDGKWADALHTEGLFVAVNQTIVNWQHPVTDDAEIAFFPPVTGG